MGWSDPPTGPPLRSLHRAGAANAISPLSRRLSVLKKRSDSKWVLSIRMGQKMVGDFLSFLWGITSLLLKYSPQTSCHNTSCDGFSFLLSLPFNNWVQDLIFNIFFTRVDVIISRLQPLITPLISGLPEAIWAVQIWEKVPYILQSDSYLQSLYWGRFNFTGIKIQSNWKIIYHLPPTSKQGTRCCRRSDKKILHHWAVPPTCLW